jgi:hypothetical protein
MNGEIGLSNAREEDESARLTLGDMLFPLSDPAARRQLEEFRLQYEAEHGPTDLTKRYTSTWPAEQRDWLARQEPKQFFDGLPPFAKAFVKAKMQGAAECGMLDDMPDQYLKLFLHGEMQLGGPRRRYRGR